MIDHRLIVSLAASAESVADIARSLGVSKTTVVRTLNREAPDLRQKIAERGIAARNRGNRARGMASTASISRAATDRDRERVAVIVLHIARRDPDGLAGSEEIRRRVGLHIGTVLSALNIMTHLGWVRLVEKLADERWYRLTDVGEREALSCARLLLSDLEAAA